MKGFFKIILLFTSLLSFGPLNLVWGAIDFQDGIFPELVGSGRSLAMGNAFISKVDDASSAFFNPAGLGTVRYAHMHLSNFHFEVNKGWIQMGTGGSVTDGTSNLMSSLSMDGTRKLLLENKGKLSHARISLMPNFTTRYLSFGYMLSKQQRATLGEDAGAQLEYADRLDHGPYGSLNISIFGGVFKIGATAVLLNRNEDLGEADPNETLTIDYKKGVALIIISGAKLTLPIEFLPTFSAKMNNSTQQKFSGDDGPADIINSIDLGFSITPQIGKQVRIHMEANLKDATLKHSSLTTTRRITAGLEFDIARTFFMRFGYGDGYGSAGLGIRSRHLEFDLTTYAVDTSSSSFRGKEDRRFAMTLSSGF